MKEALSVELVGATVTSRYHIVFAPLGVFY